MLACVPLDPVGMDMAFATGNSITWARPPQIDDVHQIAHIDEAAGHRPLV